MNKSLVLAAIVAAVALAACGKKEEVPAPAPAVVVVPAPAEAPSAPAAPSAEAAVAAATGAASAAAGAGVHIIVDALIVKEASNQSFGVIHRASLLLGGHRDTQGFKEAQRSKAD